MPEPDRTEAEQAARDFFSVIEEIDSEIIQPGRSSARALELVEQAKVAAERWVAADAVEVADA